MRQLAVNYGCWPLLFVRIIIQAYFTYPKVASSCVVIIHVSTKRVFLKFRISRPNIRVKNCLTQIKELFSKTIFIYFCNELRRNADHVHR